MGTGHQKDQAMIRSVELPAPARPCGVGRAARAWVNHHSRLCDKAPREISEFGEPLCWWTRGGIRMVAAPPASSAGTCRGHGLTRRGWAEWVQRPLAHSRVSAQLFLPMGKAECAARCSHFSKETGNLHFYINSLFSKYEQPIQNPPRARLLRLNCASQKKSCPQPQGSPACDRV